MATDIIGANNPDTLLEAMRTRLMNGSPLVSSDSTPLETALSGAISEQRSATQKGSQALELAGGRAISAEREKLASERTNFMESGRGFAVNSAALTQLDQRTEKSLRDMEQRKQELILQNDSAGASKIAEMQMNAIEFRQKSEQQAFSNLLSMGQFAVSMKAEERATKQFTENMTFQREQLKFTTDSKISEISTKFGVEILPGETLASISKKVQPLASAQYRAELAKTLKDTDAESTRVNTTGYLTDALTGGGIFSKEQGGTGVALTPASAALGVANYMKQLGLKVTATTLNELTAEATKLKAQQDEITAKVKAEEEGKQTSFLGGIFSRFGQGVGTDKTGTTSPFKSSLIPEGYGDVSPQTAAFVSLFQR